MDRKSKSLLEKKSKHMQKTLDRWVKAHLTLGYSEYILLTLSVEKRPSVERKIRRSTHFIKTLGDVLRESDWKKIYSLKWRAKDLPLLAIFRDNQNSPIPFTQTEKLGFLYKGDLDPLNARFWKHKLPYRLRRLNTHTEDNRSDLFKLFIMGQL